MAVSNGVAADGWYGGSNDDTPDIHLLYDALVDPETGVLSAGHYDILLPGQKGYRHFKLAEAVDIVKCPMHISEGFDIPILTMFNQGKMQVMHSEANEVAAARPAR